MAELGFTYDNLIKVYVPKRILSTWKYPVEKVTYRRNHNKNKLIKVIRKPAKDLSVEKNYMKGTDREFCAKCRCYFQHRIRAQHFKTIKHMRNLTK